MSGVDAAGCTAVQIRMLEWMSANRDEPQPRASADPNHTALPRKPPQKQGIKVISFQE